MQADPEVVEVLVAQMTHSLENIEQKFSVADVMSAAITYAYRMALVVGSMSQTEESKKSNLEMARLAFMKCAGMIEMAKMSEKERVH